MRFQLSEAVGAVRFLCVESGDYQGLSRGKWQIAVRMSKRFRYYDENTLGMTAVTATDATELC